MKILVTGGNGFVGGYIVKHLSELGHTVYAPGSKLLNLTNLSDVERWFEANEVDVVVHCALSGRETLGSTDPIYLSDGLLMFRNLWLQRRHYMRFVNLGTAYEFDLHKNNSLVKEYDFVHHLPRTSYGYAKNLVARIIRDTPSFFNLKLFGVFHETESDRRFFQKVKNNPQVTISNDQYLDYMYLPDILPMLDMMVEGRSQHSDVNMVYPHKYRLSELAYYMCDQLGLPKNKIVIQGSNGNNLTGNSDALASYKFNLIGIEQGLRNYK
jgi:nucleoside-diphosphate-sugar epimerase